ncbi:MAG: VCBS repeat-containing protein, partial [Bacteroidota bacterium]
MLHARITLLSLFVLGCFVSGQAQFQDRSDLAGLAEQTNGETIAIGDYDNDGWEDIYLGFQQAKNQLWRNRGDGTFVNVADELGVALTAEARSKTAVWGDINNDGWLDLHIGNINAPDRLFLNNGAGGFTDITTLAGIGQLSHPLSVNFADLNQDGLLDIYVSNFLEENVYYLNNGNLSFTDATATAGLFDTGKSMGTIIFDYDRDGDPDVYLVHDGNEANYLYQNHGDGTFTEVGQASGTATESFGMGVDIGDINRDGWLDIYIANLFENILLQNNGDG